MLTCGIGILSAGRKETEPASPFIRTGAKIHLKYILQERFQCSKNTPTVLFNSKSLFLHPASSRRKLGVIVKTNWPRWYSRCRLFRGRPSPHRCRGHRTSPRRSPPTADIWNAGTPISIPLSGPYPGSGSLSPRHRFPAHSGGSRGVPRPAGMHNPSSVFGAFYQLDVPEKPPEGGVLIRCPNHLSTNICAIYNWRLSNLWRHNGGRVRLHGVMVTNKM